MQYRIFMSNGNFNLSWIWLRRKSVRSTHIVWKRSIFVSDLLLLCITVWRSWSEGFVAEITIKDTRVLPRHSNWTCTPTRGSVVRKYWTRYNWPRYIVHLHASSHYACIIFYSIISSILYRPYLLPIANLYKFSVIILLLLQKSECLVSKMC